VDGHIGERVSREVAEAADEAGSARFECPPQNVWIGERKVGGTQRIEDKPHGQRGLFAIRHFGALGDQVVVKRSLVAA
jgi:hypothetical protein